MSVLMVNDSVDFTTLRELLEVTDGNLASHLKALEAEAFISVSKQFVGRKPNTRYAATQAGKEAFDNHLKALEALISRSR
jgi:DNA-binding PadR family transcriptional regulator